MFGDKKSAEISYGENLKSSSLAAVEAVVMQEDLDAIDLNLSAKSVLVGDLNSDKIFLNLKGDERWPCASLTKLMTALIASEQIGVSEKIPVVDDHNSSYAFNSLVKGEVYRLGDLIKAMMSVSSNNAATAISKFYGEKEFIDAMQKKSAELEMFQTTFFDESGLSFLNQSTAEDLGRLAKYIYKNQRGILDVSRQNVVELWDISRGRKKTLSSINEFAGRNDFLGGKTGYIETSKGNLISIFKDGDKELFIVVLGSENRFGETLKVLNWVKKI